MTVDPLSPIIEALRRAEAFISGFEGDDSQPGVDHLLADLRALIPLSELRSNDGGEP